MKAHLHIRPLTLKEANTFVEQVHRHHDPVTGHRFSLGAFQQDELVGVAIVGRPVSRMYDFQQVAEVTRLATTGVKNACSILYAAAARTCQAMGFLRVITYILQSEPGTSLRAAGWEMTGTTPGGKWSCKSRPRNDHHPTEPKQRWEKVLNERWNAEEERKAA